MVALGHAAMWVDQGNYPDSYIGHYIFDVLYSFHMPLFFFISGYLYEMTWNERQVVSWGKIKNKFTDLFSIYILFSILWWLPKYVSGFFMDLKNPMTWYELICFPIRPIQHMWFLWVLSILFVIVPIFVHYFKLRSLLLIVFGMGYIVSGEMLSFPPVLAEFPLLFYGGFYFALGSWVRFYHIEKWTWKSGESLLPIVASLILGLNSYRYLQGIKGSEPEIMLRILIASSAIFLFCLFFKKVWNQYHLWGDYLLQFCGRNSLQIYLLHGYFVSFFMRVFNRFYDGSVLTALFMTTFLSVSLSLTVAWIFERNEYLKNIFHPIKWIKSR